MICLFCQKQSTNMKLQMAKIVFLISIHLIISFQTASGEPADFLIGAGFVGAVAGCGTGIFFALKAAYCRMGECCYPSWTRHKIDELGPSLQNNVFGQHLMQETVPQVITEHLKDTNPQKPLVLSFHGSTGTGKTFVSRIIAEHLYPHGFQSKYVHKILSSHVFPSKDGFIMGEYKEKLKSLLKDGVSKCENSLFIIEEVDKMPAGLIDVIKPYLDYNDDVDGLDFRKSIFILIGNTGVQKINEVTLQYWKAGKPRENITRKDMDSMLASISYESGGFYKSTLIDHKLVDFHIPFLPLNKDHVRMCARVALHKLNLKVTKQRVDHVAEEQQFEPPEHQLFSAYGCKPVERTIQVLF